MKDLFEGVYLKHQKNGESICFIAGRAGETRFVQVITNGSVRQYDGAQGFCCLLYTSPSPRDRG